jgi:ATP synthase protein I
MNEEERNRKSLQLVASYAMLPFVLGVPPIIGWYIGSWLDGYFGIAPYSVYTLLVLGLVAGIRELCRVIKKHKDEEI